MKKVLLIIFLVFITLSFTGCGSSMNFRYSDSDKYQIGEASFSPTEVKKIKGEWAGTNALITTYEGEEIHIYEELDEGTSEKYQLHYYLNNDTLYIEPCASLMFPQFNFKVKVLHIDIPLSTSFESFDFNLVSTSGTFNDIDAKEIDINSVSGDLQLIYLEGEKIDISAVSGRLTVSTISAPEIKIKSVSGGIVLTDLIGNVKLESTSGSIDIYIGEEVGFEIAKVERVSGSFENEFGVLKQGETIVKYNIETVSGNITIHKK